VKVDERMAVSAEELWKLSEVALLAAYHDTRRQYIEKKFARDTELARLEWLKAKAFANGSGGVTERKYAVDASEEFGRKGQQLREMTRDLELLKVDVDLIAMIIRLRGASVSGDVKADDASEGDDTERGI
jgi:hypothetical protein